MIMRRFLRHAVTLAVLVLIPSSVLAQATIAGVVRDTSGAVLPGVSVEAASDALIEKARTVVSGGGGQYRITELPPGAYVLTFSLSGFTTVKRQGLTVSGSGVIPINVELRLGALAETVTVTGDAPLVDTQTTRRELVIKSETINTLPATRGYGAILTAVPGLAVTGTTAQTTPEMTFFTAHGGTSGEGRISVDGLTVAAPFGGGGVSTLTYDVSNAAEMQVLVSGGLGEADTGGPAINLVPKSGGNAFHGSGFYSTAGDWSMGDNLDDRLRSVGITQPPILRKNWDGSGSFGGPIMRDRLWFYATARKWSNAAVREGIFSNRYAGDPSHWDYAPDDSLEPRDVDARAMYSVRLTGQLTARNRLMFSEEYQRRCSGSSLTQNSDACRSRGANWIGLGRTSGSTTGSPESWPGYHDFPYNVMQTTWSSPLTNRVLLEAGLSRFHYGYGGFGMAPPDGLMDLIPVTEQTAIFGRPNLTYRGVFDPLGFGFSDNDATPYMWRGAVSYVTGAHSAKFGYQGSYLVSDRTRVANHTQLRYTFRDGVPIQVSYYLAPQWRQNDRTQTTAFYAQDQWTIGRLTLQGAVRYDRASSWAPAEGNGTTETSRFNPQPIAFDRVVSVSGYNDITPRLGFAYDLFGNGKTAVKVNVGRYLQAVTADGVYSFNNPAARIVTAVGVGGPARAWTDGNGNYVVDCDLLSPAAQDNLGGGGDQCGPLVGNNRNFGNANPNTTTINPDILGGWGVRPYDWQFGASVQHELLPRVSVQAEYNRRWWGNFFVTDNMLTTAADYDTYALAVPQHDHLESAGTTATYVAITPAAAARGAQNYQTSAGDYGDQTAYWQGVDFTGTARLASGLTLQGGTSTGRGVRDNCEITASLPESLGSNRLDSCHVSEKWATSFRGLASYTVPKVDVLVSASMRSLVTSPGGGVGSNGTSLQANYVVPNTVIEGVLGRLPAGGLATGTTTVNLLVPGQLYSLDRINLVDMRFAKILRFGDRRFDVGIDLYNLFNSNVTTSYQETYEERTDGASWLTPTSIAAPRLARFHVTLNF
jgi:hypothetical protein